MSQQSLKLWATTPKESRSERVEKEIIAQEEKTALAASLGLQYPRKVRAKSVDKPSKQSLYEEELYRLIEHRELPPTATAQAPSWWSKGKAVVLTADQ
eukprot:5882088-Amphidinium_carterae.1